MQNQLDQIVDRYSLEMGNVFLDYIPSNNFNRSVYMIVQYCHTDLCPLDFEKLLKSNDLQFMHDMGGILRGCEDILHQQLPLGGFLPHCRVIT